MNKGLVTFEGVWKRFHRGPAHDSLRDLIPALVGRLSSKTAEQKELGDGDFWAVRDVSFAVRPGEALGIIGGNGAGKSTTLKLLTKVLTPSRGRAEVRGRAGALIEVSAGFHPDLTGRENVFLQGAIMGMPQRLIRERFDDIVEFSGIAEFIDTPVKRYSSGMNARLGFSIAVHLEPDVLIIDEVLSVGDAEFQARAFDRIRGLVQGNIPVVIVSHQLDRIVELCTECILLRGGEVAFRGRPADAVNEYLHGQRAKTQVAASNSASIALHALEVVGVREVVSGQTFVVRLTGEVARPAPTLSVGFAVVNTASNDRVFVTHVTEIAATAETTGPFDIEISLAANIPAGLLRLEAFVYDALNRTELGQGPQQLLQVTPPPRSSYGSHQFNAVVSRR